MSDPELLVVEGPELLDILEDLIGHARQGRGRIRVVSLEREEVPAGNIGDVETFEVGHGAITVRFSGIPPDGPLLQRRHIPT